jgi:hypothetical protein
MVTIRVYGAEPTISPCQIVCVLLLDEIKGCDTSDLTWNNVVGLAVFKHPRVLHSHPLDEKPAELPPIQAAGFLPSPKRRASCCVLFLSDSTCHCASVTSALSAGLDAAEPSTIPKRQGRQMHAASTTDRLRCCAVRRYVRQDKFLDVKLTTIQPGT